MPPRKLVSDFMVSLKKELQDKREISEATADNYVKQLQSLNDGKSYANLGFLKKKDAVMAKLREYAESTQESVLAGIVSVLTVFKDKPTYKTLYNFYYERMTEANQKRREKDTSQKTEKQEANWLKWTDVLEKRDALAKEVEAVAKAKLMTPAMWNTLLSYVVLCLYTHIPPRRNQDYQDLFVVKKWNEQMSKDKNYYDLAGQRFIFNKYKTAKTHGTQILDIKDNEALKSCLALYLKLHPAKKSSELRLLVNADGSALSSVNSITRILNKIFGKAVGSSMLRHIYLSDKYDIKEMKEDAEAMGHTTDVQREYIKVSE